MKNFIKLLCLVLVSFIIIGAVGSSAAVQVYKTGKTVIFHNMSPYYVVNDSWILGTHSAEYKNGVLYTSLADFQAAFGCRVTYDYNDCAVFVEIGDKTIWQGIYSPYAFINGSSYMAPAPYISSTEPHPVMIPIETYASTVGYKGSFTTPPSYTPGQLTLKTDGNNVAYTVVGIEVNQAAQLVSIIGESPTGVREPVKYMLCSTGLASSTPNGTYTVKPLGTQWYYFPKFNCYVMYCSQLEGDICFHSLTFNTKSVDSLSQSAYNNIGKNASHGCIRLFVEDAKFIHQNCGGLPVTISPGYTNANTDAIRAELIAKKIPYSSYVNSLR